MQLSTVTRLFLAVLFHHYRHAFALDPIVTAAAGWTVQGTSANGVDQFQNIRFGQDTSGINRFTSPQPFLYPSGAQVNGTTSGAACPQPLTPLPIQGLFANVTDQSEDCLTLRIARPAGISADVGLPVMIFLYGGGYTSAYFRATPSQVKQKLSSETCFRAHGCQQALLSGTQR